MAMNFPSSPTVGQTYSVSGGPTYTWDGTVWKVLTPGQQYSPQVFTATAGQTTFTISGGYVIGAIDVFRNGVKLVSGSDYTATDLATVVLSNACSAGDTVEVIKLAQILYTDALKASSNLSDVSNAATARSNLGAVSKAGDTMTGPLNAPQLAISGGGSYGRGSIYSDVNWGMLLRGAQTSNGSQYEFGYARGSDDAKLFLVDASGRVTMPYQVSFCANADANTATTNTAAGGVCPFPVVSHNVGNAYNSSNYTFTAPVSGTYEFYAQVLGDAAQNTRAIIYMSVNGANFIEHSATTKDYNSVKGFLIRKLNAGDTVKIVNNNANTLYGSASFQNFFMGHLIG